MKKSTIIAATAAFLAVPATFSGAYAHVGLEKSEANSGSFYKAVLRIPHGCDDKATTEVRVTLPEGFISAQPQPKAGWTIDTVKGDYAQSYKVHGKDVTSGVTEVRWS
ncbi:DUF1775 domain-containing protein, partial [Paraburkholderia aspalathi]|nr:DUF1775 domain-containing protein [Paraburkholderia aspalathi]